MGFRKRLKKLVSVYKWLLDEIITKIMDGSIEETKQEAVMNKYNGARSFLEYRQKLVKRKENQKKGNKVELDSKDLSIVGNENNRKVSKTRVHGRPVWKKANSSSAVTGQRSKVRQNPINRTKTSKPPAISNWNEDKKKHSKDEFKRWDRSVNHQFEIERQKQFQRELDMQMLEVELKSRRKKQLIEREIAQIKAERDMIHRRIEDSREESFDIGNDRSRRKKWNKDFPFSEISMSTNGTSGYTRT
jgi:hypothetical protein